MSPRLIRWMFRLSLAGFLATLAVYGALVAALAWPAPLFSHARTGGAITFHARDPLPPEAVRLGQEITALLSAAPLGAPAPVDVWLVPEGPLVGLFFSGSPRASGLTYPVVAPAHVFLRHADIPANRLVRDGRAVPPPRTLGYYLVHEITHLQLAAHVGRWRIVRMPRWINEGYADYVALGPAPPAMVARGLAGLPLPAVEFGTYARERVCVTLALTHLAGGPEALFALDAELPADRPCPVLPEFGIALAGGRP
ncbi:hypothetical protein [Roseicyclus persicicus]|uniref:DUF2268 domain-containing protein n=1 Tax=Roseicyclus persicicus TaxID=2650661 RepID=A0A7X6GZI0_9RHOB|nr:hypothetical protein [Roseibacterium persicicum]NKX44111.1 hypothetical protein [Roseibacterium persicicum]